LTNVINLRHADLLCSKLTCLPNESAARQVEVLEVVK